MEKLNIKLLYVEDDEIVRETISNNLKLIANKVFVAENGKEGLKEFQRVKPDILISDVEMPKMNGLDMIEKIKEIDENIAIILTTALNDEKVLIRAIDLGVSKFMPKPVHLTIFLKLIRELSEPILIKRAFENEKKLFIQYKNALDEVAIISKTDVNEKFCKITQYTKEELIGKNHSILRHSDTNDITFKNLWNTVLNKQIWKGIIKSRRKDGHHFYADLTIVPILNRANNIEEFIAIRYDVTDLQENKRKRDKNIISHKAKMVEREKELLLNNKKLMYQLKKVSSENKRLAKQISSVLNPVNIEDEKE